VKIAISPLISSAILVGGEGDSNPDPDVSCKESGRVVAVALIMQCLKVD
jgi:hypothetical protein